MESNLTLTQTQSDLFRKNVCIPYFRDIYKDLSQRSDDKQKGINKISLLEYAQLPGILGERFFQVMDLNFDGYIDYKEFLTGLMRIYCSTFDQKMKFVFEIYDFDNDGYISKNDILTILRYVPVTNSTVVTGEGKFTQEGGGVSDYQERVETMDQLYQILDLCFGDKERINYQEFAKINEEVASDMLLSVLNLFREKLPCSENFWRYKRNFELNQATLIQNGDEEQKLDGNHRSQSPNGEGQEVQNKTLASPQMTKLKPLSPYQQNRTLAGAAQQQNPLLRYVVTKKDPIELIGSGNMQEQISPRIDSMDEQSVCNSIPITKFQSNHLSKKKTIDTLSNKFDDLQLSPTATQAQRITNFKHIDSVSPLIAAGIQKTNLGGSDQQNYDQPQLCLCGLPCLPSSDLCENCLGKNSVHIEGQIIKKQKKGGVLKKYWFSLLGKELYSYKNQGDKKHKDMQSLVGVHLKNEQEEIIDAQTVLHPFMLIFPNKRRIYYLQSKGEKEKWMDAIKKVIGYANLYDFYDIKENLGQGKYGVVKRAIHKKTQKEVAVKIVKKKELSVKDQELLKREIEVLKICQHPYIIRLDDIFENQDYLYIVMEYLQGGDLFGYLEKRRFKVSEDIARQIAHQLATAIYYLHSFGIAHRDLKPENILMVSCEEDAYIKIVDFGLSKSFGPGETCKEPFGTLCYVAPEILLQRSYDKSVDLWSLGVIMHLMLSGTLPFDDQDDREIAKKTIYQEVTLGHPNWERVSDDAKDLVLNRISLEHVLEHPWIAKINKKITELRRKSSDEGDKLLQFVAYSNTDLNVIRQSSPRRGN